MQANEPGSLAYIFHCSQQDPSEIVLPEVYAGGAALQAHGQTPHTGEFRAGFANLFDASTVKIERLERVGGFARAEAGQASCSTKRLMAQAPAIAPVYETCARLACERNLPLLEVYRIVQTEAERHLADSG